MTLTKWTELLKYNVLGALALYNTGSLEDLVEVPLRPPVLLALRWPCSGNLGGLHLCPLHLDAGEGHPSTFNTGRPLKGIDPRKRHKHPLHESEVAARYGLGWP